MGMSKKFRDSAETTIPTHGGHLSILHVSDHRLLRIIEGVVESIRAKEKFLASHSFPVADYENKLKDIIRSLHERLEALNKEKQRRGL